MSTPPPQTQSIKDVRNISELQSLLNANKTKLVVLKAYLDTCPVCKAYAPIYSQFPNDYPMVVFVQYNAGRPTDLTTKLSLKTVPTTSFYTNGSSTFINQIAGINLAQIKQTLEAYKNGN